MKRAGASTSTPSSELEAALQQSEARYRSLVQRAGYGIYFTTIEGRFIDANPALVSMLGYDSAEQLLALDVARDVYLDPEERERLIAQTLESGSVAKWVEVRWKRRDGTPIMVRIALRGVSDDEGRLVGFEAIAEDVTERRRQEELLRRSERMASLGTTLAGVAHELNNPLAAIMGFAQLLLKREWPEDDRIAIETINREAERSAKIVRDLLTLARKRESHRRTPVSLNDVVGYIMRTRRYALETSGIACEIELEPALPLVCGDRTQLEQVLLNLVTNAEQALRRARATPLEHKAAEGPRLTVRTRREDDDAVLEIVDNGPGVPADARPRIWDPFWTTRTEGEGTGLGLSVVHHIVMEHGGTIEVSPADPSGACFRARFPTVPATSAASAERMPSGQAVRALDVLVIATDVGDEQFLTRFLTSRGHAVLATSDATRARRFIEQMAFDTVLIDAALPAAEQPLIEELQRSPNAARSRVVLVAAPGRESAEATSLDLPQGIVTITKPYDVEQLRAAVEQR